MLGAAGAGIQACGQTPQGWVEQTGSGAFHVKTPPGWVVETAKDAHVLIKSKDGSEFVLLQPFMIGPEGTSDHAVPALVDHWKTSFFPNAQLSDQNQISTTPDEVVAKIQFGANGGSRANVLCYNQNGAGMLYAIAAPAGKFASSRDKLMQVLQSFHYGASGPATAPAQSGSGLTYTSWTEPNEQAYTVQVPQGWNVSGGLTRTNAINLHNEVVATSPDGQLYAQYGESQMLPFKQLTGTIFQRGFHPGSISEYHGWFMFLDYETGDVFSKGYLEKILVKKYQGLKIGKSQDCPQLTEALQKMTAGSPIPIKVSVGETDFTYNDNGQTKSGMCFATTIFSGGVATPGWMAIPGICTGPADKLPTALEVLAHLATPKWSQDWANRANNDAANYTKVIQATAAGDRALSDHIYNSFTSQLHESGRQMENVLTGMTDVKGPDGTAYHVPGGHNYYYYNAGTVVGSNSPYPPDIGFQPLTQF